VQDADAYESLLKDKVLPSLRGIEGMTHPAISTEDPSYRKRIPVLDTDMAYVEMSAIDIIGSVLKNRWTIDSADGNVAPCT
jgi:hypothetical protein